MIGFLGITYMALLMVSQNKLPDHDRYVSIKNLIPTYHMKGKLMMAHDLSRYGGSGLPSDGFLRLYFVGQRNRISEVKGLNDLSGKVNICSQREALQFVRLRSSPSTCYLFKDILWFEIMPFSAIDSCVLYGIDDIHVKIAKELGRDGILGMVREELAKQLPPIIITYDETRKVYKISRNIVTLSYRAGKSGEVFRMTEQVNDSGNYKILRKERIANSDVKSVNWRLRP